MKTAILIPAYREGRTISEVVRRCGQYVETILVVNDGSPDNTASEAASAGAEVITNSSNIGKGASLRAGLRQLIDQGVDYVVMLDGDLQHLPEELPGFLRAAENGAAMVLGSRAQEYSRMPLVRRLTNMFMSWLISMVCHQHIPDSQCGFRMLRRDVVELLLDQCSSSRFDFESEMLFVASAEGVVIDSVPVSTIYGEEQSKINPLVDTIRFIKLLLSYACKARKS